MRTSPNLQRSLAAALATALTMAASPGAAHHSFAMYDQTRQVTLAGTVKTFEWSNPHSVIWVIRGGMGGQAEELWTVELPTSPGNLSRLGWTRHSLNPGDKVAVDVNPLRDGRHGGSLKKVTLVATGQVLTVGLPSAVPTK
jgi:hypothetical protein